MTLKAQCTSQIFTGKFTRKIIYPSEGTFREIKIKMKRQMELPHWRHSMSFCSVTRRWQQRPAMGSFRTVAAACSGKTGDHSRPGRRKPCWELGRNTNPNPRSQRLLVLQPLLCILTSPLGDAAAHAGTRSQALASFLQRGRALL